MDELDELIPKLVMERITGSQEHMLEAAREYIGRRDRNRHPDGAADSGGRWYPSDAERQVCCGKIRGPSRGWPWTYAHHCRTVGHVANLYGVEVKELRKIIKAYEKYKQEEKQQ